MPKSYYVARVDIADPVAYGEYTKALMPFLASQGCKVLAAGGRTEVLEGTGRARNLIIEAPDFESAKVAFLSPAYVAIKALREGAATVDLILIDGGELSDQAPGGGARLDASTRAKTPDS